MPRERKKTIAISIIKCQRIIKYVRKKHYQKSIINIYKIEYNIFHSSYNTLPVSRATVDMFGHLPHPEPVPIRGLDPGAVPAQTYAG